MGPQKQPFPVLRYTQVLPGSAGLGGAGDAAFPTVLQGRPTGLVGTRLSAQALGHW